MAPGVRQGPLQRHFAALHKKRNDGALKKGIKRSFGAEPTGTRCGFDGVNRSAPRFLFSS